MAERALVSTSPASSVSVVDLEQYIEEWLIDCDCKQHSPRTNDTRRIFTKNLLWFLRHRGFDRVGLAELRQFFLYLRTGHEDAGGRWGNSQCTKPLRPISIKDYHTCIGTLFKCMVAEEILESSPMQRIERPIVREEIKQPLSTEQTHALLRAARISHNPRRDEAILLMLFDSGVRATELIQLKEEDVDLKNGCFTVIGKGNKKRMCYLGKATTRALMVYLRKAKLQLEAPLFSSNRGTRAGEAMTRSGLLHLIKRMALVAGVRANIHQMRRTFATTILQNGSDLLAVRDMLGHSGIQQTIRYCAVSTSHIESQHQKFSPANRLAPK